MNKLIELQYMVTSELVFDILTKALARVKFEQLWDQTGYVEYHWNRTSLKPCLELKESQKGEALK